MTASRFLRSCSPGLSILIAILLFAHPVLAQVNVTFGSAGISSLKYNGADFLLYGDLRLNQVTFTNANGSPFAGTTNSTVTIDPAAQTQTRTYDWGKIVAAYAVTGNQLSQTVSVTNSSSRPIQQIWFEALGLRFPSPVTNYDGFNPVIFNTLGQPAVAVLQSAAASVAVAADDVVKPLQLGFPYAFDRPANTQFPVDLNTGTVSSYPNSYPVINRSIPAGGSDQFRFSLRFGPSGSPGTTLASDVYRNFAAAFPPTLTWADRRPIGQLILSTSAAGYPNNPRGWFSDRALDTATPAGIAAFQQRVLAYANNSIAILKQMNAQGMVTWDIEGEQFPQPTSYIGDPRIFATLAPEMAGIADQYFQLFRTAGFRVGVCLRPQQLQIGSGATSAQQIPLADPTQILLDKATYAHNRWGATLFYVDSNVNATDPNPIDPAILRTLSAAFPDSLFIPEHSNTQYYAYSGPYRELRQGYTSTTPEARSTYPNALTVINTADGPLSQNFNALVAAVQAGDILMYRSWFADPQNAQVLSIYQTAGGTSSSTSVTVTPPSASLNAGQTQQFTSASTNSQVIWTISPAGAGTISSNGLYSAPASLTAPLSVSVIATSAADHTRSGSATVNLTPAVPVSITVSPATISLKGGQSQQFAANLSGSTNTGVTWSAVPAGVGTLSGSGLYTAPASVTSPQTVSVTATSLVSPSKTASATVELTPPAAIATCGTPANGAFLGCYYSDRGFTNLAFTRVDPQINFVWSGTGPGGGIGATQYAVRWQGNFAFAAGNYQFTLATDDGSRLFVDGQVLIDGWGEHPAIPVNAAIALSAGTHLIQVDYFQLDNSASASLAWIPAASSVPVTVSITPANAALFAGQSQQFSATVTGVANQQVTWSVSPAGAGTVSQTGLYTAPASIASSSVATVTATSIADSSKIASSAVTLMPPAATTAVSVTVSPQIVNVSSGQMQPFAATVTGTTNSQVTWSLSPLNVGSISTAGILTAPVVTSLQAIAVTATSVADPTKSATAIATVTPAAVTSCGAPATNAFTGCYYSDRSFDPAVFSFIRLDPQINFVWTNTGPGGNIGLSNYQVRWQGNFTFEGGSYQFTTATDDGARLYIDGQIIVDYWGEHPAIPLSKTVSLPGGVHLIQLDYIQLAGAASANLSWNTVPQ